MTINCITPSDSYFTGLKFFSTILFKPFTIGLIFYIVYLLKFNIKVTIVELLLTLTLIAQVSFLFEIVINDLMYSDLISDSGIFMSENSLPNPTDNIPRNKENVDYARLIRYLSGNIAALTVRRPMTRAIGLTIANAGNILADVATNEEKANYWIDQYNHYVRTGRFRGGQGGSGPFERGTNPFENSCENTENLSNLSSTSNFSGNFYFFKELLSPVEHSIPLETLINVHFIMILGLFVMVILLIILTVYFYINLIIIFNKDYFLNKVKNKYVLMYAKYVIFKTRVDIIVIGLILLSVLCFMVYILHYLIVHPIIIK